MVGTVHQCPYVKCTNGNMGVFPGRSSVVWGDWYTHELVNATSGGNTSLSAPLGHINLHVRDGTAILLHAKTAYTIEKTHQGPYLLLVSLPSNGIASGSAYIGDDVTALPTPNTTLAFSVSESRSVITPVGNFNVSRRLCSVTVLGVPARRSAVTLGDQAPLWVFQKTLQKLYLMELDVDLDHPVFL